MSRKRDTGNAAMALADQTFPPGPKVPNVETRGAMEEARAISWEMRRTGKGRFARLEYMIAALEKTSGE